MSRDNNNRFSVLILERDVLDYHNYKLKYNQFYQQCKNFYSTGGRDKSELEKLETTRDYWYKKYISKMGYLEKTYRRTNIYTQYHDQLENGYVRNPISRDIPTAIAQPVTYPQYAESEILNSISQPESGESEEQEENIVIPSAPPLPVNSHRRRVRRTVPADEMREAEFTC